jgi:2-desacetyl-2-hydroxyethyl bacteriochlorophyllide A dehydrogenase
VTVPARVVRFVEPGAVRVEERPVPEPGPGELLVESRVSAVSPGTERLVYRGQVPDDMALDETIPALAGGFDYPLEYGYATVGEVTAVGEAVAAGPGSGTEAGSGSGWLGETVFAFHPHESHFTAEPGALHRVPDDVPAAAATLLPTVETAVTVALDATPRLGERAAVYGQGVVGLATTAQLAAFPLDRLVAVDAAPRRRELARRMGADEALSPAEARATFDPGSPGASGTAAGEAALDLSVELSGNPEALDDALSATGYAGRVVVGSWYGTKRADLDLGGRFHRSRIELRASQVSTLPPALRGRWDADRRLTAAWDRLAALDADALLTHRLPVEEAPRAYELLEAGPDAAVGILFTYGEA